MTVFKDMPSGWRCGPTIIGDVMIVRLTNGKAAQISMFDYHGVAPIHPCCGAQPFAQVYLKNGEFLDSSDHAAGIALMAKTWFLDRGQ